MKSIFLVESLLKTDRSKLTKKKIFLIDRWKSENLDMINLEEENIRIDLEEEITKKDPEDQESMMIDLQEDQERKMIDPQEDIEKNRRDQEDLEMKNKDPEEEEKKEILKPEDPEEIMKKEEEKEDLLVIGLKSALLSPEMKISTSLLK